MALMRAARHAAIAVMALTASTHAAAHDVGTFNPDAPGNIYSLDALEVPISPVVAALENADERIASLSEFRVIL